MTLIELRNKRAKAFEAAKAFLEAHTTDGILSAEDSATYDEMEKGIKKYDEAIGRLERLEDMDAQLSKPTSTPITEKPETKKAEPKRARSTDEYKNAFWNQTRAKNGAVSYEVRNALQEGVDSEGGYLVPDEFERTLVKALTEDTIVRKHAHVITTNHGSHKIPIVTEKGTASWIEEEGAIPEGNDVFGQEQIDAHKVGTIIKVSEELLNDSAFDLESYFSTEFARRIGDKEEEAFFTGDGVKKPLGVLTDAGGAEIGVTSAASSAITADEIVDLFYSLKAPYRKNAIWVLNDATIAVVRKLKDENGQYLWQPALHDGGHETLLGKKIYTSPFMPELGAGKKPILFGDFKYYWIGDREGITFRKLSEKYADSGQVGFLATKRLDGKLILPEAIKVLKMKNA